MRPFPLHFLSLWVSTFGLIFTFHFHVTQKQLIRFLMNYVVFKYVLPANIFNFYEIFLTGAFLFASWYSWRWWINRHLKCVKENLKTRLNEVTRQFIQTVIAVSCWDKCWTNFGVYWLIYASVGQTWAISLFFTPIQIPNISKEALTIPNTNTNFLKKP